MNLKPLLLVFFFAIYCNYAIHAQQIFKLSQYTQHNFIIDPAAAGAEDHPSIGIVYRSMWSGIDGGPQTFLAYGDKYFAKKQVGIAAVVYNDVTGPTQRSGGQIDLSYSVKLNENGSRLMFGVGGEFMEYYINIQELAQYIPNDPLLASSDNKAIGDASAGIYLKTSTLNIGLSVQQLIQSKLNYITDVTDENLEGKLYRHYNLMASYNWKVDDDNVIVPSILASYLPNAPGDIEGGVNELYKDFLWVGLGFHINQSYSAFAGVKINHKLSIGYAFDQYKTPLNMFDAGSSANEISLRYFFIK